MIDVRYFSGSGHCAHIARVCAKALGTHAQSMKEGARCEETLLFIFPVYGERMPPPAKNFVKNCRAKYAAFIAVYGGMSYGRALWDAQKRFAGTVVGAAYLPAEHSLIGDGFRAPTELLAPLLAKLKAENFSEVHIPRTRRHPLSFAPALRSRIGVRLVRDERCTKCGGCDAVCPMHAMHKGAADQRCIRCLACIAACRQNALSFRLHPLLARYLAVRKRNETVLFLD